MNYFFRVGNSCLEISFNDHTLYIIMCFYYLVVIVASFSISAIIYCIAQTTTRMEHRARTKLFQRLFFLFSSTLWTFITCVPFRVLFLVNMMFGVRSEWQRLLTDVSFKLLVSGSIVNPVITIATQRIYRDRLIKYLGLFKEVVSKNSTTSGFDDNSLMDKRRQSSKTTIILESAPLNIPSTAL
ncbi:unnamed protein product, partial [Mesorhabditis spiculigera]